MEQHDFEKLRDTTAKGLRALNAMNERLQADMLALTISVNALIQTAPNAEALRAAATTEWRRAEQQQSASASAQAHQFRQQLLQRAHDLLTQLQLLDQ